MSSTVVERRPLAGTRSDESVRGRGWRFIVVSAALAAVGAGFLSRAVVKQDATVQVLRHQVQELESAVFAARIRLAGTQQELGLAREQLSALATAPRSPNQQAHEDQKRAWLERVRALQAHFAAHPGQTIPEMELLTDDDWLRLALHARLEDAEQQRSALAEVRTAAKQVFFDRLMKVFANYQRSGTEDLPKSVVALAPSFVPPIDPAILQRYEINRNAKLIKGSEIREIAPIDADFDTRVQVSNNGGGGLSPGPAAWIPGYAERQRRASQAYAAANLGAWGPGVSRLLPYFDPPLEPEILERLLKAEARREE